MAPKTPGPEDPIAARPVDAWSPAMNHRWKSALTFVGGWLLGAVFVRLALDWSDTQPYDCLLYTSDAADDAPRV